MSNKNIDIDKIKDKLQNVEVDLPENDWDMMENMLPVKHDRYAAFWKSAAAAVITLLLISSALLIYFGTQNNQWQNQTTAASFQIQKNQKDTDSISTPNGDSNEQKIVSSKEIFKSITSRRKTLVAEAIMPCQQRKNLILANKLEINKKTLEIQIPQNVYIPNNLMKKQFTISQTEAEQWMEKRFNEINVNDNKPTNTTKKFSVGLLAAMNPNEVTKSKTFIYNPLYKSVAQKSPETGEETTQHNIPLSFGISVSKNITDRFTLQSGINYSYLSSKFIKSKSIDFQQLHYIGIPAKMAYTIANKKNFNFYIAAGGMIEKGIEQSITNQIYNFDGILTPYETEHYSIKGVQTSVNSNLGISWEIVKQWQLYFEPGYSWYIPNNKNPQPESIRTSRPYSFNLSAGIRLNLRGH